VDLGLKDATAVVAGGGRGMGLAAARCLADDGARVAIVGRTEDVLEKAARDLTHRGTPDALGVVADTGDAAWNGELNVLSPGSIASRRNSSMTGANINVDGGSDFT
jgi:3-oxoacyl-[acyl-carrier protein] reductase